METIMVRFVLPAFLLLSTATHADEVTGQVRVFDREANVIASRGETIFKISDSSIVPADLQAGETITTGFKRDGENGVAAIQTITRS
jgi:hypothetical protein